MGLLLPGSSLQLACCNQGEGSTEDEGEGKKRGKAERREHRKATVASEWGSSGANCNERKARERLGERISTRELQSDEIHGSKDFCLSKNGREQGGKRRKRFQRKTGRAIRNVLVVIFCARVPLCLTHYDE